jgi:hypothetical protein
MNETNGRRRFQELLPWHVNGTLERSEREWVEHYLREHPDAQAELRWTEALQTQVRQSAADVAPEVGLDRFLALIHAEARATPRAAAHAPAGFGERLRAFFAAWHLSPTAAVAAAVIAAQAGIIGTLLTSQLGGEDPEYSTVRSLEPGQLVSGPVLQVSFRADTPERELRSLLVSVGGTLVGGPGQLGNYLIAVPPDRLEQASQQLAASTLVEDVAVLENMPARE